MTRLYVEGRIYMWRADPCVLVRGMGGNHDSYMCCITCSHVV